MIALSEWGVQLHLYATEVSDGFFAARTNWRCGGSQITCVLFFRRARPPCDAAYAFAIVQTRSPCHLAACLERTLEQAFLHLRCWSYEGESWRAISREELRQHLKGPVEAWLWHENRFGKNLLWPN